MSGVYSESCKEKLYGIVITLYKGSPNTGQEEGTTIPREDSNAATAS